MTKELTATPEEIEQRVNQNQKLAWLAVRRTQGYAEVRRDPDWFLSSAMFGLFKAARTYDQSKGQFSTYAVTCARWEITREVHFLRSKKRDQTRTRQLEDFDAIGTADAPPEFEGYAHLDTLLSCLDAEQRELISKHYGLIGQPMSRTELAQEQRCSVESVRTRLLRIYRKLQLQANHLKLDLRDCQLVPRDS